MSTASFTIGTDARKIRTATAAAPAVFFMRTADPIRRFDIAPAPAPIPGTASMVRTGEVMGELCKYVDVCIANEEDASDVFGIKASNTDVTKGAVNHEGYKDVAKQLADRFGFQKVAITLRESISANDNNWSAMLYDGKDYYFSKKYAMHIVDRVGGGDSFGGGLIYACLSDMDAQSIIEFAVAASCLKHSIEGDMNMVSVDEVKKLAGGDGSGRVQR